MIELLLLFMVNYNIDYFHTMDFTYEGEDWLINFVNLDRCDMIEDRCMTELLCKDSRGYNHWGYGGCVWRNQNVIMLDFNNLDYLSADGLAVFEHELKHIENPGWAHE